MRTVQRFTTLFLLALLNGPLLADGLTIRFDGPAPLPAGKMAVPEKKAECGPISERIAITDIEVEAMPASRKFSFYGDNPSNLTQPSGSTPIALAVKPNGEMLVGWADDAGHARITPVTAAGVRRGPDLVIENSILHGLVGNEKGGAALLFSKNSFGFVLIDEVAVKQKATYPLSGHPSQLLHQGSLAYDGNRYAAYFGVSKEGHEGDHLLFLDKEGKINSMGWDWGCSISIDVRVIANAGDAHAMRPMGTSAGGAGGFQAVCLTSPYPGSGVFLNNQTLLATTGGTHTGEAYGTLGGVIDLGDKLVTAMTTTDAGTLRLQLVYTPKKNPQVSTKYFVTRTDQKTPRSVHVAKYGQNRVLVSWHVEDSTQNSFAIYDDKGRVLLAPAKATVYAHPRSDFQTLANGDVAWATAWGNDKAIRLVKVSYCE